MSQKRIKKTMKKEQYLGVIEALKNNLELSNAVLAYIFAKCFGGGELVLPVDDFDDFVKKKVYVDSSISEDKKYCTLKLVDTNGNQPSSEEAEKFGYRNPAAAQAQGVLGFAVD